MKKMNLKAVLLAAAVVAAMSVTAYAAITLAPRDVAQRAGNEALAAAFEGLHRQTGLVLALVMFFVYYSLMSFGFSMGEAGTVPPAIGLWIPNALFFFAGLYGIRLAERERAPRIVSLLALLRGRKAA